MLWGNGASDKCDAGGHGPSVCKKHRRKPPVSCEAQRSHARGGEAHGASPRGRRSDPLLSPLPTLLNGHESTCTRESPDETHSALRNTEHWARRKCYPFWITALFSKELTAPKEKTVPYGLDLLCWSYCDSATSTVLAYWYTRCSV